MQPDSNKLDNEKLNSYVDELLLCFPEHVSELTHELALDHQAPVWQVFCGVIMESYLQGTLSAFTVDPAWLEGFRTGEYVCKHCKKPFVPVNLGQLYCCNECGDLGAVGEPENAETVRKTQEPPKKKEKVTNAKPKSEPKQPDPAPITSPTPHGNNPGDFADRLSKLTKKLDSGWTTDATLPVD